MTSNPEWLEDALAHYGSPASAEPTTDLADLMPGDIWTVRAEANDCTRLVLVLDCVFETNALHVGLLSNEVDFLTDMDIRLDPIDTSLSYAVMLETGFTTEIWWRQAVARHGAIGEDLLDQILDFVWEERPHHLEPRRGLPVPDCHTKFVAGFWNLEREALASIARQDGASARIPTLMDRDLLQAAVPNEIQALVAEALVSDSLFFYVAGSRISPMRTSDADLEVAPVAHDMLLQLLLERAHEQLLRSGAVCFDVDRQGSDESESIYCAGSLPTECPAIRLLSRELHEPGPVGDILGSQLFDAGIEF